MAKSLRVSEQELARLAKLTAVRGIDLARARVLHEAGITEPRTLAKASKKRLTKLFPKVDAAELKRWKKQAGRIRLEPAEPAAQKAPEPGPTEPVIENEPEPGPGSGGELAAIQGLGSAQAKVLNEAGVSDFRSLARASVIRLERLFPGVAGDEILRWKKEARKALARKRTAWLMRDRGENAKDR